MATRLFLHAASNALAGTFPTSEQSVTFSAKYIATGANTLRTMDSLTGVSQATLPISVSSSTTYDTFYGYFCSKTFDANQTVGAGAQTILLNLVRDASSGLISATAVGSSLYVWRPSTGAKVGTIYDGLFNPVDTAVTISNIVTNWSISAAASVAALAGDVLILEVWQRMKPAAATARRVTMYYDGTTVSTTQSAVVTNHASFLDFASDTLTFSQPTISSSFGQTLATVALSGAGTVAIAGTFSNTLATVALSASGVLLVSRTGSFGQTLATIGLSGVGTVKETGTFNNTFNTVTLSGAGQAKIAGTLNTTLDTVTLSGVGAAAILGGFNPTPMALAVSAQGTVGGGVVAAPPPVVASSDGSGANGARSSAYIPRPKFKIPTQEKVWSLDNVFGVEEKPVVAVPDEQAKPVESSPLAAAMMGFQTTQPPTPTVPKLTVKAEEYSDEDLLRLLLLVL